MGETSEFYKHNEEARKKRLEYQKRYNKKPDQVKKRVELNRENRRRGTFGDDSGPRILSISNRASCSNFFAA